MFSFARLIIFFIFLQIAFTQLLYGQEEVKPEYKIKFGTIAPVDTPWHKSALSAKTNIEKRTGGKVKLLLFMGGQLGGEIQMMEGTQLGTIESWGGSTGAVESLIPDFGVFDLPFLWDNQDELYYVLDNIVKEPLFNKLEKIGLKGVAWTENGWRNFANNKHAIHKPEDLKDIKWRSQESKVHLAFWESLGATGIPINMTEVFSALQTGIVDGTENSLLILSATGWWEVLKYLTVSQHIYQPAIIVFNLNYWKKLPNEYQNIIEEEFTKSTQIIRDEISKFEPELIEAFKSKGFQINYLTEEEKKLFMARTKVVPDKFKDRFSGILPLIKKGQKEFREKKLTR